MILDLLSSSWFALRVTDRLDAAINLPTNAVAWKEFRPQAACAREAPIVPAGRPHPRVAGAAHNRTLSVNPIAAGQGLRPRRAPSRIHIRRRCHESLRPQRCVSTPWRGRLQVICADRQRGRGWLLRYRRHPFQSLSAEYPHLISSCDDIIDKKLIHINMLSFLRPRFNRLKHSCRFGTRYDRRAIHFTDFVLLAAAMIWLR